MTSLGAKKARRERKQRAHVFTEALAVVAAGEEEVAVQVEVVRGQLRDPHDGLLAVVLDGVGARLLLGLPHQTLLQAGDDLALRVDVLHARTRNGGGGGCLAACSLCVRIISADHESLITPP